MPEVTVAIIAVRVFEDLQVLLIKRSKGPFKGYWCFPGGHVEKNEKVVDAIARELKEETGLDVERGDLEFVTVADEIYPDKDIHNVVLGFVSMVKGEVNLNSEALDYKWCSIDEILAMKLAFDQQKIVKAYEDHRSALEVRN